jgi:N-succinyldiaminopimelate aminotransferase
MNEALSHLQPYPFEKLAAISKDIEAPKTKQPIDLSIGEPKHSTPEFIIEEVSAHLTDLAKYPSTRGTDALREVFIDWLIRRYSLPRSSLSSDKNVLPVNGTREALFAIAQCVINRRRGSPLVLIPNPFYQIYEGATLLAGAEPWFVNCLPEFNFLPDFEVIPKTVWARCQLVYLCSPGNPTGSVLNLALFTQLMELADRYEFIIAADECYSEIYLHEDQPPLGLLQAAAQLGRTDYHRCVVFHSLSKRSSVPGLRSGFVAGDAGVIEQFLLYRTYHGCAMPRYVQAASCAAWRDELHVIENRQRYRDKLNAVLEILAPLFSFRRPEAGFYLWPELPVDDIEFTRGLLAHENITVLPGSFLARIAGGQNPGRYRARIALVPPLDECIEAARRIRDYMSLL